MPKGDNVRGKPKQAGSGRKPGVPSYKTRLMEEILSYPKWRELYERDELVTPGLFWIEVLNDPLESRAMKHEVAKAMAKYVHSPAPQFTETKLTADSSLAGFTITLIKKEETNESTES
jgi:hypothetical protein